MPGRFVEPYKGPISFEQMAEKLRKLPETATIRTDETWRLWGYGEDVENDAVRRRTADYNERAKKEGWLLLQSTSHYRPYMYDEVRDYRRKPKNT
jgi:hypothetical protein